MLAKAWQLPPVIAAIVALLLGGISWGVMEALVDGEPWDHAFYWLIGYPLLLITAGFLGYFVAKYGWLWGPLIIAGQALWMIAVDSGAANLLPLTVLVLLVIAIPALVASYVGSKIRASRLGMNDSSTAQN